MWISYGVEKYMSGNKLPVYRQDERTIEADRVTEGMQIDSNS